MSERMSAILLGVLTLAAASPAWAGQKEKGEVVVTISWPWEWAIGGMGGARNSADDVALIGCNVAYVKGGKTTAWCIALDVEHRMTQCHSSDPAFVQLVLGITPSSYLYFMGEDGVCTELDVINESKYEPPVP